MNDNEIRQRNFINGVVSEAQLFIGNLFGGLKAFLSSNIFKVTIGNEKAIQKEISDIKKTVFGLARKKFNVQVDNQLDYKPWFKGVIDGLEKIEDSLAELHDLSKKDETLIKSDENTKAIINGLLEIKKELSTLPKEIVIPKAPNVQKISGNVTLENPPKLNTQPVEALLADVLKAIQKIKLEIPEQKEVVIPKEFSVKNLGEITASFDKFTKTMEEYRKTLEELPSKIPKVEFPDYINVGNFPPQRVPQPVTNFSLNPMKGIVRTSRVLVTPTRVALPAEALENRRSVIIYNLSDATVYIGGDDVTTDTGLPIPSENFSPPIDAGKLMRLSAIVTTGIKEIRVLEASDTSSGGA